MPVRVLPLVLLRVLPLVPPLVLPLALVPVLALLLVLSSLAIRFTNHARAPRLCGIGDAYNKVKLELLSPDAFLRLSLALDNESPGLSDALSTSLEKSVMGFSIWNVVLTTERLLYLIGSMGFGVVVSLEF